MNKQKNEVKKEVTVHEWYPPWIMRQFIRLAPWGFPRQILLLLEEEEKTLPEIIEGFSRFMKHFGHFGFEEIVAGYSEETLIAAISKAIENLKANNYVKQNGAIYSLTSRGHQKAKGQQKEYQRMGNRIERLLNPQTVSLVSLATHLILAIIKLIAGFLSGSIGLISDGIDTAMDGLSSILVYIGLRLKKERIVNIILVLLMLVVGIITGTKSVQRVFRPEEVEVNLLTFGAALLSGLVCLLLSIYQRFVAIRSKQPPLIAQAVDSRNHAIVAAGVIIGLIAALLNFPLLDTIVGLVVAILILRSGVELALELIRTLQGEEMNFYKYELGFVEEYRTFQNQQLSDWLLYVIEKNQFKSQEELLHYCHETLNVQDVPILRELGFSKEEKADIRIRNILENIIAEGLITAREEIEVSSKGIVRLSQVD